MIIVMIETGCTMNVYFLKVSLRGVSPMVWRRLRVPGTASIAMLHSCIQVINGFDDSHLNQFRIFGKDYGVYHDGGVSFRDNAHTVYMDNFDFDVGDKFIYEYNFYEHIVHDIRIEAIKNLPLTKNIIYCVRGAGMPGATKYDAINLELNFIKKIVSQKGKVSYNDICDYEEDLRCVKFMRKDINHELALLSN